MALDGRILLLKGLWMRCSGPGMSISCCLCTCIHRIILDTPAFCERSLCSEVLSDFVNENFVSWGGSIREGFKMSNSLKASRYPFCAVVMPAANQRIALIQQVTLDKMMETFMVHYLIFSADIYAVLCICYMCFLWYYLHMEKNVN
ncbi:UBX domain-containing protein [Euphorbia peplus]|nr:UBX domain-containing protein [Euphorbia peplus]